MENFLLIFDELDDAVATLRALWPQLLSFLLATGAFALSIFAAMHWPLLAAVALLLALMVAGLSTPRFKPSLDFNSDP